MTATAVITSGLVVGSPSTAGAICIGLGSNPPDIVVGNAAEGWRNNTCDNSDIYHGRISDLAQDGYCAVITYIDVGYQAVQATDCTHNGVWNNYTYDDVNNDHATQFSLCGSVCNVPGWSWAY